MKTPTKSRSSTRDTQAIRRRVKQFYRCLNAGHESKCFEFVDPALRNASKVDRSAYVESLRRFRSDYPQVRAWHIRINVHPGARASKTDRRPFAYVYVVWQDANNAFHMFRERWVKHEDRWFTRVVGLVPNPAKVTEGHAALTGTQVRGLDF